MLFWEGLTQPTGKGGTHCDLILDTAGTALAAGSAFSGNAKMHQGKRHRKGSVLVYATVAITALLGFCSLGVDFGRVALVKTELQRAADAAARAGAAGLVSGVTTAQDLAVQYAAVNAADGASIVLDPSTDVEFDTWDSVGKTFSVLTGAARSNANAMRITARRNGIPLMGMRMLGKNTQDVRATSIAMVRPGLLSGFYGLDSMYFKGGLFAASYDSSVTTNPTHAAYRTNCNIGSNGPITGGSGNNLYGSLCVGPSGSNATVTVHGGTMNLGSAIPTPADPPMTPVANPGGVSQTPSVSSDVTWQGGTYYFTSWTISSGKTVNFSGPATIYLNGDFTPADPVAIYAYNDIPANLTIYQSAGHTFNTNTKVVTLIARLIAPGADVRFKSGCSVRGSIIAKTLWMSDDCDLYYDEQLGTGSNGGITVVK